MRPQFLVVGLALILLVSATVASTTIDVSNAGNVTSLTGKWFDYVVVIMLENHSINDTYGVSNPYWSNQSRTCLGNCTYFTSLANQYGLAKGYTNTGVTGGSAGDYVAIVSGYGNTGPNCNDNPVTSGCVINVPNITDRLEAAHLTWKAYMEDYPIASGCYNDFTNYPANYGPNHNPFIYFSDIQNTTRCSHIVNANSQVVSQNTNGCLPTAIPNDDLFLGDLNSVSAASNYMWLTPNTTDDLHDCVTNDVSVGNAWMQRTIPQILGSTLFRTKRAALFVTFDEPDCTYSGCPSHSQQIYATWASNPTNPTTRLAFKSAIAYTHYSQLRTIEDNWNLGALVPSADGSASNMHEFFP